MSNTETCIVCNLPVATDADWKQEHPDDCPIQRGKTEGCWCINICWSTRKCEAQLDVPELLEKLHSLDTQVQELENIKAFLLDLRLDEMKHADRFCDNKPEGPCLFCLNAISIDHRISKILDIEPLYEVNRFSLEVETDDAE